MILVARVSHIHTDHVKASCGHYEAPAAQKGETAGPPSAIFFVRFFYKCLPDERNEKPACF